MSLEVDPVQQYPLDQCSLEAVSSEVDGLEMDARCLTPEQGCECDDAFKQRVVDWIQDEECPWSSSNLRQARIGAWLGEASPKPETRPRKRRRYESPIIHHSEEAPSTRPRIFQPPIKQSFVVRGPPYPRLRKCQPPSAAFHSIDIPHTMLSENQVPTHAPIRRRKGLPLNFEIKSGDELIMTGYDTGTQANHISLALAHELGYIVATREEDQEVFQLPTGKSIKSIGRLAAAVGFAHGSEAEQISIVCYFNVFQTLAVPCLIGMAFLNATETLSKYTNRLVELPREWKKSRRLISIGSITNGVSCLIDSKPVFAYPDTGSEIPLISGSFAMRHNLLREYSCEELMLADGSLEYASGYAEVDFSFPILSGKLMTKRVRFHVLKNLHFDAILDEDLIDQVKLYREGAHAIVKRTQQTVDTIAAIIHVGSIERSVRNIVEKCKGAVKAVTDLGVTRTSATDSAASNDTTPMSLRNIQTKIDRLDQEENRRRGLVREHSSSPNSDQELARRQIYERKREELLQAYELLSVTPTAI